VAGFQVATTGRFWVATEAWARRFRFGRLAETATLVGLVFTNN